MDVDANDWPSSAAAAADARQGFKRGLSELEEGDEHVKNGDLEKDITRYDWAIQMLLTSDPTSYNHGVDIEKHLSQLYANLGTCHLKKCDFFLVCKLSMDAFKYSPTISKQNPNIFFNWGKALRLLKAYEKAEEMLQNAFTLKPACRVTKFEIQRLYEDREFSKRIEPLKKVGQHNLNDEVLLFLQPFWDLLEARLEEFVKSVDEVLTIKLNKNPENYEILKCKVSGFNLNQKIVLNSGQPTDYVVIEKN